MVSSNIENVKIIFFWPSSVKNVSQRGPIFMKILVDDIDSDYHSWNEKWFDHKDGLIKIVWDVFKSDGLKLHS